MDKSERFFTKQNTHKPNCTNAVQKMVRKISIGCCLNVWSNLTQYLHAGTLLLITC